MRTKCNCQIKGSVEEKRILDAEKFLKAINNKNRLRIVCLLKNQTLTVGELQKQLQLPQNMTSHNIAILKKLNLLIEQREGQFRKYKINQNVFGGYIECFSEIVGISMGMQDTLE